MRIDVVTIAQDVRQHLVSGKNAVVIDVLRATSTMCTALANGCSAIYPVTSPEDAFLLAASFHPGTFLIGGERGGIKVEGFDLGNSPREYTSNSVGGKKLIMTTTNGTLAIRNCRGATNVYLAALLNATTVARRIAEEKMDTVLVCSGTEGAFTLEDAYCAGMVAREVRRVAPVELSDMALACILIYERYENDPLGIMNLAIHGQKLRRIGFGEDLAYCAQKDLFDIVPVFRNNVVSLD